MVKTLSSASRGCGFLLPSLLSLRVVGSRCVWLFRREENPGSCVLRVCAAHALSSPFDEKKNWSAVYCMHAHVKDPTAHALSGPYDERKHWGPANCMSAHVKDPTAAEIKFFCQYSVEIYQRRD